MHPETNHSQSSVPSSLNLLADLDILAKSVDPDFVPVSDVVLLSSFDLPANTSINDLSKGTLVHRLISDSTVRPSSDWWMDALDTIFKNCPAEIDVAPCAAEIYLARVAQSHIEAGHAQLDYLEGKPSGMQFIDSSEQDPAFVITKQGDDFIPALATGTKASYDAIGVEPDTSTATPTDEAGVLSAGGPIIGADDTPLTSDTFDPGFSDAESKDLDGALVREGRRGEEVQHDNVDAAAMGGLGLSGDEEIKGNDCGCDHPCPPPCGCEEEFVNPELLATRKEEEDAKQGLKEDIELLTRKIQEADKWKALLDKLSVFTGEQDAIKRLESHIHPSHPITAGHADLEMKAGGT